MYRKLFWNNPKYKAQSQLGEVFWHDFLTAAKCLVTIDSSLTAREKAIRNWVEPDIYAVFDKLRQDYHNELPYSKNFITEIDRSIEREVAKEVAACE